MDEKTLRILIEAGSVKQMRIIGDGALFHVDVVTAKKGALTALTAKGSVKTWATLDATAKWIRSLGHWDGPVGCYSMASWTTGVINLMFSSLFNYAREVRQRWSDSKTSGGNLSFSKMIDDAQEERRRLWENPPPCGSVIRYVPECVYEEIHGEFRFQAADVEQELQESLQLNPRLANGDEGAILRWAQGCDESINEPTDVPSIWARFQYVADDLVRAGKAEIYCKKCEATIGADQIATNDDSGKRGWNLDRLVCPHGHSLLVAESVHVMIRND